jgi:transposase
MLHLELERAPRNTQGHIELTKDHLNWLMASNKYTFHPGEEPVIYRDFH